MLKTTGGLGRVVEGSELRGGACCFKTFTRRQPGVNPNPNPNPNQGTPTPTHGYLSLCRFFQAAPPDDGSDAGVEQVLDQDVARVLGAHGARLEEAEARLG